jgi:translocator protein
MLPDPRRLPRARRPSLTRWRDRGAAATVVALPLVVGGLGTVFTAPAIPTWYRTLSKPPWNPPDAVFGPVWTTLYLAMGIALLQVSRLDRNRPEVRVALALFATQLALNLGWSYVFFGRRNISLALAEIAVLDASVVATIVAFARVRRSAAALLVPYLAWSLFATALNAEIARRNS